MDPGQASSIAVEVQALQDNLGMFTTPGGAHGLCLSDQNLFILMGAAALTVPKDVTLNLPIGFRCKVVSTNATPASIAAESGATINSLGDVLDQAAQWAVTDLVKTAANTWLAYNGLAAA